MKDVEKDEFISTLSHEIRTPLTSIKGFSKTLLDSFDDLSDEQKKKFIKIIFEQSQRLINLVENVLNVSKINYGKNDCVLKKVDMKSALNRALSVIQGAHNDFVFDVKYAKNLEFISADTEKLQQVLINLLDNAVKYSKNSKKIEISVKNDKNFGEIGVKNFGTAIEEKYFEKIFEKFFRISSYLTSSTQGSGLGLYITKTLLEQMKGEIKVNSGTEPEYTAFCIKLPLYEAENAAKRAFEAGENV